MQDIREEKNLKGKRVLVRVGINMPIENGEVTNLFRIESILETIQFLKNEEAKIILIGHFGRSHSTIEPVYSALKERMELSFVPEIVGEKVVTHISRMENGDIVLLENVRLDKREYENNDTFAKELASLADIFVNEAFSASHRMHTSLVGVPKFLPSFAGIHLQEEVRMLSKARAPKSPSLFVLGGAKFETKLPLVEKFSDIYETIFICGALANDFFKAKGFEVGESQLSGVDVSRLLIKKHIYIPSDVVVISGGEKSVKKPSDVEKEERIVDAGPETLKELSGKISDAKSILWNGPLGEYEKGSSEGTDKLTQLISDSNAESIVGGGDTVAAIANLKLENSYTFLSTGGGAMLQFLLEGTLPAIEALDFYR